MRRGLYQPQLERWLTHFPREHLHVIVSERWFHETDAMMTEVLEFLGLPTGVALPRTMRNRNKSHPPYDEEVLARLRDFYRPHNERLAEFLGMELGWP